MYFPRKPSASQQRGQTARRVAGLVNKGRELAPVTAGRAIGKTFWGKAWCDNIESYSDYENRLPRGRTYLRNGSVVDLQIVPGISVPIGIGPSRGETAIFFYLSLEHPFRLAGETDEEKTVRMATNATSADSAM
mgnify:CR=1 FL=1